MSRLSLRFSTHFIRVANLSARKSRNGTNGFRRSLSTLSDTGKYANEPVNPSTPEPLANQTDKNKSRGTKPRVAIPRKDPITVTERAVTRIEEMLMMNRSVTDVNSSDLSEESPQSFIGVKIGVKRRGCNGLSYTMNYASRAELESSKFDVVRIPLDLFVLVDPAAVFYIAGTGLFPYYFCMQPFLWPAYLSESSTSNYIYFFSNNLVTL